jgi:hypothetical protein
VSDRKDGSGFSLPEVTEDVFQGLGRPLVGVLGAVEVGVVEEHNSPGGQIVYDPAGDALRSGELAPVLAPGGPEEGLEGSGSRFLQAGRAVDAIGRAVKGRSGSRGLLDGIDPAGVVLGEVARAPAELKCVVVSVEGNDVTLGLDAPEELGSLRDLLTDYEERGPGPVGSEEGEDLGSALGMGAVVEGEHDSGAVDPARELQGSGGAEVDGGEEVTDHEDLWTEIDL